MAQLNGTAAPWSQQQTWAQYRAIAWLRWRMLVNIARRSDSAGEIVGRIVLYLLLGGFATFLTLAAGGSAYLLVSQGHLATLWVLFWGIFILCQMLNINLGQPGTTFDPTQLIRFPLRVPTFVPIRLFFNLLSPANVMAMLMSLAAAVGIAIAQPGLWLYALVACAVFAIANVLFSRMVFAWVDRWLSTRRAREIFTAAIFVFSLGFQYVNFTFNPAYNRSHRHDRAVTRQRISSATTFYHRAEPFLHYLPPNLTSRSLQAASAGQPSGYLADTAGCAAYAAIFLLVFALRMRTEFHGESISDTASASSLPAASSPSPRSQLPVRAAARPSGMLPAAAPPLPEVGFLPASLSALLGREWTYVRRNTGLLYGLVTPLFLVILFALRMGRNFTSPWVVPAAIAYSLVGIAPMSYNSFGMDGTGAELYFMAPVPLRLVFLSKNLLHFAIAALEVTVVLAVMAYVSGPPRFIILVGVLLWVFGSLLLNTSIGNRRSISAPKKVDLTRMARKQASQTSALISLGVLLACVAYGAGVLALAAWLDRPWLSLPCFAALALAGALAYRINLGSIEDYTLAHRDTLFEELGKS